MCFHLERKLHLYPGLYESAMHVQSGETGRKSKKELMSSELS